VRAAPAEDGARTRRSRGRFFSFILKDSWNQRFDVRF
jgi:hypothetical protein